MDDFMNRFVFQLLSILLESSQDQNLSKAWVPATHVGAWPAATAAIAC